MELLKFIKNMSVGKVLGISVILFIVVKICIDWLSTKHKAYLSHRELTQWCVTNDLNIQETFIKAGVKDVAGLALLSVYDEKVFAKMPKATLDSIENKLLILRQVKVVEYWLRNHQMSKYYNKLISGGVTNLKKLSEVDDTFLAQVTQNDRTLTDYIELKHHVTELQRDMLGDYDYTSIRAVRRHMNRERTWRLAEFVWFCLMSGCLGVVTFLLFSADGRRRIRNIPHSAVFRFIKEKCETKRQCRVTCDWDDPMTVGNIASFRVEAFTTDGRPSAVTAADDVLVTVARDNGERVPVTIDYRHEGSANTMRVSFTVYQAGDCVIAVSAGGSGRALCSPVTRTFHAGTIDASKTAFTQFCSTVVCSSDTPQPLTIDPRDSYGNAATYSPEDQRQFKIKVCKAGSEVRHFPSAQIISDQEQAKLTMYMRMDVEGCFQATVTYGDEKLRNGDFDIIVLNSSDYELMNKSIEQNNRRTCYEARLVSSANEVYDKPKKVYIYISPKQLTVKEFYLKIIGKKLFTFRVCPSTKFIFHGDVHNTGSPTFTIDDGCQPKVTLTTKDHVLVAATFSSYLLRNIGGSESFRDKQVFFYHEVRQLHNSRKHLPLTLKINRSDLLNSSYKETKGLSVSGWCSNFTIKFNREEGLDYGGLRREWFELLCEQLFDHSHSGLFARFSENSQGLVHPNTNRSANYSIKHYEFAGKVVAKCVFESALGGSYRQNVKVRFTRSFLAQIIGLRVNYKHFESDDPELYTSKIQYIRENPVEGLDLFFTHEQYDSSGKLIKITDLIPNGAHTPVTDDNKLEYLDHLTQQILVSSVKEEVDAFLRGINELLPDHLLSIFDENELELLLCGTNNYNIDDFKLHHIQCGTSPMFNKVVGWFWTIVGSFTNEQMARLLQFTTGSSMLPPGGFSQLTPNFQLSATFTYGTLPTAHTCFNQLCLPDYENIEAFHKALTLAINEGSQGFGFT